MVNPQSEKIWPRITDYLTVLWSDVSFESSGLPFLVDPETIACIYQVVTTPLMSFFLKINNTFSITDCEQTKGPEEETEGVLHSRTRTGHGRLNKRMVPIVDQRNLPSGLWYVRIPSAFTVLLVQHRPRGQSTRVQSDRRADGTCRLQFHHPRLAFSINMLQKAVVASGRTAGGHKQCWNCPFTHCRWPGRNYASKYQLNRSLG